MLSHSQILCTTDVDRHVCQFCLNGKMTRQVFSACSSIPKRHFERVSSDVQGLCPIVSVEGYKYYVIFMDHYTRFTWFFPLMYKSQVFFVFKRFYAFVQSHFNGTIQFFQSDGGGEFTGLNFKKFLESKEIVHLVSCPHTPQQNGIAERKHRHIIETAIILMSTTALPHNCWTHAYAYAIFLINRMMCKSLVMQSHFYKLCGYHPQLCSLKVFGTTVYPLLRPYNKTKLEA